MALTPLASTADLTVRDITVPDPTKAHELLMAASAVVRSAAGSPISQVTSTIDVVAWPGERTIRLPGLPVQSVASVSKGVQTLTDWVFTGSSLWRACGWVYAAPEPITVTYTHGLPEVPKDVVDLVCALTAAGLNAASEDYAIRSGVIAERIDDYSVQWAQGADAVSMAMELPPRTRHWLARRFGGGYGLVTHR